jgi:tetratricopeptide (TPR) repeat protein
LQRGRETGDASYFSRADAALVKALELGPDNFEAMISRGSLALTRHQFEEAITWAEQARAINPYRSAIYGIVGDAHVERGEYEAAFDAFQEMMDRRPELASYSRVSYARELLGDVDGAIAAMQQAVKLGPPTGENTAWCRVQLGNLYATYTGDLAAAEAEYRRALAGYPDYVHSRAGLGRVAATRGDYPTAIGIFEPLVQAMPLPEFIIALGDVYAVAGRPEGAERQYALVRAVQELNRANGVDTDLELVLFDADQQHDPATTLEHASQQYALRPSIKAADALAWARYQAGDFHAAQAASTEALRLGTRDPLFAFHAGVIAYQLGDTESARTHLGRALAVSPSFSIVHVQQARQMLATLPPQVTGR